MTKIMKVLLISSLLIGVISCTSSGDPYAKVKVEKAPTSSSSTISTSITDVIPKSTETSPTASTSTSPKTASTQKTPQTTPSSTKATATEDKFDATDQKIVDFIDQKVYEDSAQIKKITVESIQKLQDEKKIRMTKREFLARTYQIIRDNNMTSFYLAVARLLNEIK